jgi:hypothetical protein
MADEITLTIAATVDKPTTMNQTAEFSVTDLLRTMTGNDIVRKTQTIGTTDTALDMGAITNPGFLVAINLDATSRIQLYNGAAGLVYGSLGPGDPCCIPLDPTCVPYAKAIPTAARLDYLLISR